MVYAKTVEEAVAKIRAAGLTPISMKWEQERGITPRVISSLETYGPGTFNHARMNVVILRADEIAAGIG